MLVEYTMANTKFLSIISLFCSSCPSHSYIGDGIEVGQVEADEIELAER